MIKSMNYKQAVRYLKAMESMVLDEEECLDFSYLESELNIKEPELDKIIDSTIQNVTSDEYYRYKYMKSVIDDFKTLYDQVEFELDDETFKSIHGSILDMYRKHMIDLLIDLINSYELEVSEL